MQSPIEENYLKAIFKLSGDQAGNVSTSAIAEELNINSASVTDMIKKLATKGLIDYEKYQGVQLTGKGRAIAVDIIRKHRLWEVFLVEKLHFNWGEVHDIAEQLEHIKSPELINRLDDYLGNPTVDPHGDPIPDRQGRFHPSDQILLSELPADTPAVITGVREDSKDLLTYLEQKNLLLGARIRVKAIFEFDSSLLIHSKDGELSISRKVAENLFVRKMKL